MAPRATHLATGGALLFAAAAAQMIQRENAREMEMCGGMWGRSRLPQPPPFSPDRDALKLAHAPPSGPPLLIVLQVILASLLCGWGAALGAGALRPVAPAANQNPCDRAPLRPDFVVGNTRAKAMPLRLDPF